MANTLCRLEKGIAIALMAILTIPFLAMISTSASADPEPIALSLRGDCFIAPHFSSNKLAFSAPGSPEPGFDDTSEFMIGNLSVDLIFLESDGTIDPKTETWTDPMKTDVQNEVEAGVDWWATNPLGPQFNFTLHSRTVTTGYEPINRPQNDEGLWINETMTKMGYSSGDYFYQTRSHINDMRALDGNDWGCVIFMVNSLNDVDGRLSDGLFGYSYLGGPFMVMTYDNDGWGIARMNLVTAHEMGHIFYATDEYDGIPQFSGYLNSLEIEGSGCIMDTSLSLSISNGTLHQIGWYDSDSDGVFDIVDTQPEVTLTSLPLQYSNSSLANYSGTASVIPYPNRNPLGPGNDVTVAKISQVYYSLDGSGWMAASASDGAYDQTTETFNFSFAPTDGFHSVSVMAVTDQGVYSGSNADDDFYADRTEPDSWAQPLPTYTNSTTFAVQGNASDNLGLSSVELWYSRNGTSYSLYSTLFTPPWQWQFISGMTGGDGAYDFYTIATDIAGNRESQPSVPDANTVVDTTKPISTAAGLPSLSNSSIIAVSATASDLAGIASVELWYSSPDETWRPYGTIDAPPWQWFVNTTHFGGDGHYDFFTRARDNAGNYEDYRFSFPDASTTRDTVAPMTSTDITGSQSSSGWYTADVNISLSSYDQTSGVASSYYRIDSGDWETYSTQFNLTEEGTHVIEYYSEDNANNSETHRTMQVEIDRTGPVTQILTAGSVGANGWFDSAVTIGLEANDNLSGPGGICYRFDNGAFTELNGLIVNLTDGLYTLECFSMDLAGNNGTHVFLQLKIDTTAPSISNETSSFHATNSEVTISWTGNDDLSGIDHYEVMIDGGHPSSVGDLVEVVLTLRDGTHTITIVAIDSAGNMATRSISVSVDTNLLSTSGPAGPWLDIGLFGAILAGIPLVLFLLKRRGKDGNRRGEAPQPPPLTPRSQ
ncbi:MAG: hypothetical protein KJ672_05935 [Candidatus Thermoplasmatota archaeon]|nr:hypothetical protein [Candidatus Thermoplasmatota archaeon]